MSEPDDIHTFKVDNNAKLDCVTHGVRCICIEEANKRISRLEIGLREIRFSNKHSDHPNEYIATCCEVALRRPVNETN